MEPLAIRLREEGELWGIPLEGRTHSVSLYADDLIYVGDITADLTTLWTTLTDFEKAAGLKVNWAKSSIYPLHPDAPPWEISTGDATLPWTGMPHDTWELDFHTPQDLLEGKHYRTLRGLKSQVNFWRTLPLAPIGMVALSKMIMVPRLHFANVPVIPPRSFFQELDSLLISLIWGGRAAAE